MKNSQASTTNLPNPDLLKTLRTLVRTHSKHSDYQLLHPSLKQLLGDLPQPTGRLEVSRQRYMARLLPLNGLRVLDIGANTGYFTFAALADGAREVICQEGNAEHARFLALAAEGMHLSDRMEVRPYYYNFSESSNERFDVIFCLNVLHHLGDDFGVQHIIMEKAKAEMLGALNSLSSHTRYLWMQLGFNWKGNRNLPLFDKGTKSELIDFVRQGTRGHWQIKDVAAVSPELCDYEPINDANLGRFDSLGEFQNRPIFLMASLNFDRDTSSL